MSLSRKLKATFIVLAVILTAGLTQRAFAVDVDLVQKAIVAKHARWIAAETHLSQLGSEQLRNRLGLVDLLNLKGGEEFVATDSELPSAFDWRDLGMVSDVRDQGACGSCWAFCSIAALESLAMIEEGETQVDLSEQFLVSYDVLNQGCRGGRLDFAANFLKNVGTVSEICMPYRGNSRLLPPPCPEWRTNRIGVELWQRVPATVASLKAAVFEHPIAAGMYVFEDFVAYAGGVYSHVTGELLGGHGILIVGWDDGEQCFIVKNSWGKDWGEQGFFRIAYSEVSNEVRFGVAAVAFSGLWQAGTP